MARGVIWQVERAVARAADHHQLWSPGATLVVGVSGGADSLCLLGTLRAMMARHDARRPGRLVVAHLDHGLRGEDSDADARWVRFFAESLGCAVALGYADVSAEAQVAGRSIEDAARVARYTFLRRVQAECSAERICVGHTSDDQLETLVMHWLRGSGLAGLSGMSPLEGDIARPLLFLTRAQTEAYCKGQGWEHREDSTNADRRYLRNRVRLDLIPALRAYNPNLRQTVIRNAALLADDEEYVSAQAAAAWQALARVSEAIIAFSLDGLRSLHRSLRHRLFQRAWARLGSQDGALEASHIQAIDALVERGVTGGVASLPRRLRARMDYDTLVFEREPAGADVTAASTLHWSLRVPGSVELTAIGWRLSAWNVTLPPGLEQERPPHPQVPFARRGTASELRRAELRVYVDADLVGDTLEVRLWQPGDRFQPLGTPHEKKVQDYFVDAKVPRAARSRVPLVFSGERLIWLGGQRIDDRVKLTSATRRTLALQLEPLTNAAGADARV